VTNEAVAVSQGWQAAVGHTLEDYRLERMRAGGGYHYNTILMTFDYKFFVAHMRKKWTFSGWNLAAVIEGELMMFFKDPDQTENGFEIVFNSRSILNPNVEDVVRCFGAYSKGGQDIAPLETSLKTNVPLDFREFFEQFGECLIITRGFPVKILPLLEMVTLFEDDPDIQIEEGRFFRFASFEGMGYHLGLRRDDHTNEWQVVLCNYGLLYSEMIGPQGRECVVASSFYAWLKQLIETNGYPDECAPRDSNTGYYTVVDE
jgi:hypothetical protein